MRNERLKSVTVYFNAEEYSHISEEASDHGVSVSGYIRARLGMAIRWRGAPVGKREARGVGESRAESSGKEG